MTYATRLALGLAAAMAAFYGCGDAKPKVDDGEHAGIDAGAPGDASAAADVGFIGLVDGGDTSAPPVDAPTTCAATSQKAEVSPVDMYVMLDRSYSMASEGKWDAIVNAVGNVVFDPRFNGLGLGLQYFPLQQLCTPSAYAVPDVAMGTLPAQQQPIIDSLLANNPWGNSPMVPALEGAVAYTKAWQLAHVSRTTVIVLATDGLPDESCQYVPDGGLVNSLGNVVSVAQSAANDTPPLRTFVIGVGDALGDLDQIAVAGGTTSAITVDTALGVEQQFMDALDAVRKRALSCDYVIPPPEAGAIDFAKVNVRFSPNDGNGSSDFTYVDSAQNCAKAPNGLGWYYDDPSGATRVELCPGACTAAKASQEGQIDVLFGCEIKAAPNVPVPVPK
jgi:hypothetical protein